MKRNMKKTLVSGLALSMLLPLVPMEPAEAAGWKQDGAGWWWQDGIGLTEIVTICMRVEQWRRIHGSTEVM